MKLTNLSRSIQIFLVGIVLLIVTGCATNPVTGKSEVVLMSEEQEILMGTKHNNESVLKAYQVYEHPQLQAYVEQLGQKLASQSHRRHLKFSFTLLDSPQVNAFALPGGYIYITRGIMTYMNSEEELAGVLGHEIGHVTARHSVRQDRNQKLTLFGQIGLSLITGNQLINQVASHMARAWVSGYGRENELEADRLGAEYLARTNYDPEKMLDVIGILKDQEEFELQRAREERREPRVYHGVFATHPKNDRRLQGVIKAADQYKNQNAEQTNPEDFLRLMEGVVYGHGESQGIIRGNKFYHNALNFVATFPEGWRIENHSNQLVAIRADGNAAMVVEIGELEGNESSIQFLNRKFGKIKNGQLLEDGGYTGLASGEHTLGKLPARVTTVPHQGSMFVITGLAKSERPDQLFIDTAKSIRQLKSSEEKLAQPKKIKLIRARAGDTFALLAESSGLGKFAEGKLRLLNGLYPDGEIKEGQLVKIVQ